MKVKKKKNVTQVTDSHATFWRIKLIKAEVQIVVLNIEHEILNARLLRF